MAPQIAFVPLAALLRNRRFGLILTGVLSLHIIFVLLHLPLWECPFFKVTGLPCPGCGLTRACLMLLQGDVHGAVRFHAFAPIFIILISMMMLATVLPKTVAEPFIQKAETLERKTGITLIILSGLILYWLARLLLSPTMFAQLIRG
ncbi:MAG TPA: DUF2752 domain-containing protein [Pyrinomonadaceae bacterium]|nr:DUF2752 domain-containing protein [Pyrinomonadaceae bacterium]